MAIRGFRDTEVLNKVLNAAGDALNVDLDNATISAGNINVDLDYASDTVTVYYNTAKDGTGTDLIPILDADGHLQIDVLTAPGASTLYEDAVHSSGEAGTMTLSVRTDTAAALGGTDGDYQPIITDANGRLHVIEPSMAGIATSVDGLEGLLGTIDVSIQALETQNTTIIGHVDGIEALLGTIDTDTSAMVVDLAAMEVLDTTRNSLLTTIDSVLDNILLDTAAIQTAAELLDNAISGNEMQVDIVASLPAGTNAIGKLAANDGVDIGNVDVTSTVLATNAATDTIQATQQTALDSIVTAVEILDNIVDGSEAQVDVVSSALPTNAATDTIQATQQTSLTSIDGHLEKLYYDTMIEVSPADGSDLSGAPFYMLYIGVAGDVTVDLNGSGANITFKNLQSGQMLPVVVDRVYSTGTDATDIIALK